MPTSSIPKKKKGDRSDCNNYRGMSLLGNVEISLHPGVIIQAAETYRANLNPGHTHGFRPERSRKVNNGVPTKTTTQVHK